MKTARAARGLALLPALLAATAGLAIALHHPLGPVLVPALFIGAAVAAARWPRAWLVVLPAALPLIGLAPWSGWLVFEEVDLLVLAAAAGGYAAGAPRASQPWRGSIAVTLVVALYTLGLALSVARGVADAGGFGFGWFQGYHEPLNSLRLAKPLLLALLLLPLWRAAWAEAPQQAASRLSLGLVLGLLGVALAAAWERLAYTGLLNFSTDYRTSALFWEMHVGGAAIDGYLALTLPFALRELLVAGSRRRWLLAALATLLGSYAALTTFSRALYLALPLACGLLWWLQLAQRRRLAPPHQPPAPAWRTGLLVVAGYAAAAAWLFPATGYRGLLALLGAVAVLLALPGRLRGLSARDWALGAVIGAALGCAAWAATWVLSKGAYIAYALAGAVALAALVASGKRQTRRAPATLAFAGFVAMLVGLVLVARHWGTAAGFARAWPVAALLLGTALVASLRSRPAWPDALRWQASLLGLMVVASALIGVFAGGATMSERFAEDRGRLGGRLDNWRLGLGLLDAPLDWAFGRGVGRFPAHYALAATGSERRPGDWRLGQDEAGNSHLVLSAGTHPLGWLELLRVTQRIAAPSAPLMLTLDVRAAQPVTLQFEVCEKHLLYSEACLRASLGVRSQAAAWQTLQVPLTGRTPTRGAWYAPRLIVFSVAVANQGGRAQIDNLRLADATGRDLLANGSFDDGLARWFFTSDGHHQPWHIESIVMTTLFDQGLIGVVLLLALIAGGLWRTVLGSGRNHPLAPALAAGLVGFCVVGLFSSVTDVPRVALLFYGLLLLALGLRREPTPSGLQAPPPAGKLDALDPGRPGPPTSKEHS